jgi:hypothetical protein
MPAAQGDKVIILTFLSYENDREDHASAFCLELVFQAFLPQSSYSQKPGPSANVRYITAYLRHTRAIPPFRFCLGQGPLEEVN